ncbi:MAG: 30S ribosomal protein S15 [Aquificaceae bacterium]
MALPKEVKQRIIETFRKHERDTGSSETQIALLTERIARLTEHLKKNKKDIHSRRGLIAIIHARRKHLEYLKRRDYQSYLNIVKRLNLKVK